MPARSPLAPPAQRKAEYCMRARRLSKAPCGNETQQIRLSDGSERGRLGFDAGLQPDLPFLHRDDVFHFLAALLFAEFLRLLAEKVLKGIERKLLDVFAGLLLGFDECFEEPLDLAGFPVRIGARHAERWRVLCPGGRHIARRRAEVPRHVALFSLLEPLAEHFAVPGVGLREAVVAEAFAVAELGSTLGVALHDQL